METQKAAEDSHNKENRNNSRAFKLCYKHSWLSFSALEVNNKAKSFCYIINPFLTKLVRSRWLGIGRVLFFAFLRTSTLSPSVDATKELGKFPAILTEQA